MITTPKNKVFFFLVMTFILPIIISYVLFFYKDHFHFRKTNQGTLLNPPLQMQALTRQWQIIFAPRSCNSNQLEKVMFGLHQLRKALGKDERRVGLILLINQSCQMMPTYHFRKVIRQNNDLIPDRIYLADPLGNVFMYYSDTTKPMPIFKDLKKVLGASQIG